MNRLQQVFLAVFFSTFLFGIGGFCWTMFDHIMKIEIVEDSQAVILKNQTLILQALNKDTCSTGQGS